MSGVCNKTSNNKFFDCPARMDDGRHFTDYRPNSYVNDLIRYSNKVMSSYNARQFLQANATKLMAVNNKYNVMKNGCNECTAPQIPFETKCIVNKSYSVCYPDDCNGVGLRYITGNLPVRPYNPKLQTSIIGRSITQPMQGNVNTMGTSKYTTLPEQVRPRMDQGSPMRRGMPLPRQNMQNPVQMNNNRMQRIQGQPKRRGMPMQ
jgi:hypothetical protein